MANAKSLISENSKKMAVQRGPLKSGNFDENDDLANFLLRCWKGSIEKWPIRRKRRICLQQFKNGKSDEKSPKGWRKF